jgi:hypothetical protein
MNRSRIIRSVALAATLATLAAPTAGAQQDLRSPDTRDGAATAAQSPRQELRSPDARDASEGRGTFTAPDVTIVAVPERSPSSDGFQWRDAAIGAGALVALSLLVLAGTVGIRRRHGVGHAATVR